MYVPALLVRIGTCKSGKQKKLCSYLSIGISFLSCMQIYEELA